MSRLPNAPLQEVIFEVRWDLDVQDGTNMPYDPKFDLGLGRLSRLLEERFPEKVRKYAEMIPVQLMPHVATWQFRPSAGGWPLIQLGHGVLTVNDTDLAYDWETVFFPLIKEALAWLAEAYDGMPSFSKAELRYIDSVKLSEHSFTDWEQFIANSFNLRFQNAFNTRGPLKSVGIHQVFNLPNGEEILFSMSNGKQNDQESLIWQTAIAQPGSFDKAEVIKWVDKAHVLSKELFKDLCKPDFYATFNRDRG